MKQSGDHPPDCLRQGLHNTVSSPASSAADQVRPVAVDDSAMAGEEGSEPVTGIAWMLPASPTPPSKGMSNSAATFIGHPMASNPNSLRRDLSMTIPWVRPGRREVTVTLPDAESRKMP